MKLTTSAIAVFTATARLSVTAKGTEQDGAEHDRVNHIRGSQESDGIPEHDHSRKLEGLFELESLTNVSKLRDQFEETKVYVEKIRAENNRRKLALTTSTLADLSDGGLVARTREVFEERAKSGAPIISGDALVAVLKWIKAETVMKNTEFCWKQTYGRGIGVAPGRIADCPEAWINDGASCRRQSDDVWRSTEAICPAGGYAYHGATCFRGHHEYYRSWDEECPWALGYSYQHVYRCVRWASTLGWGSMTCPDGYDNLNGIGRCYKPCPDGYTNLGEYCHRPVVVKDLRFMTCNDDEDKIGARCYPRGGHLQSCFSHQEYQAGLCYDNCDKRPEPYHGVGPICWQKCDETMTPCGAGCASSRMVCAMSVLNMVLAPIMAAVNALTFGLADDVEAIVKGAMKAQDVADKANEVATKSIDVFDAGTDAATASTRVFQTADDITDTAADAIDATTDNLKKLENAAKGSKKHAEKAARKVPKLDDAFQEASKQASDTADVVSDTQKKLDQAKDQLGLLEAQKVDITDQQKILSDLAEEHTNAKALETAAEQFKDEAEKSLNRVKSASEAANQKAATAKASVTKAKDHITNAEQAFNNLKVSAKEATEQTSEIVKLDGTLKEASKQFDDTADAVDEATTRLNQAKGQLATVSDSGVADQQKIIDDLAAELENAALLKSAAKTNKDAAEASLNQAKVTAKTSLENAQASLKELGDEAGSVSVDIKELFEAKVATSGETTYPNAAANGFLVANDGSVSTSEAGQIAHNLLDNIVSTYVGDYALFPALTSIDIGMNVGEAAVDEIELNKEAAEINGMVQNQMDEFRAEYAHDFQEQTSIEINEAINSNYDNETALLIKMMWADIAAKELMEKKGYTAAAHVIGAIDTVLGIVGMALKKIPIAGAIIGFINDIFAIVGAFLHPQCADVVPFPCTESNLPGSPACKALDNNDHTVEAEMTVVDEKGNRWLQYME